MTLGGAVRLWGGTVLLGALAVSALFVLHGRWGVGLAILGIGAGVLLGVHWLVRTLKA